MLQDGKDGNLIQQTLSLNAYKASKARYPRTLTTKPLILKFTNVRYQALQPASRVVASKVNLVLNGKRRMDARLCAIDGLPRQY